MLARSEHETPFRLENNLDIVLIKLLKDSVKTIEELEIVLKHLGSNLDDIAGRNSDRVTRIEHLVNKYQRDFKIPELLKAVVLVYPTLNLDQFGMTFNQKMDITPDLPAFKQIFDLLKRFLPNDQAMKIMAENLQIPYLHYPTGNSFLERQQHLAKYLYWKNISQETIREEIKKVLRTLKNA